jgi:polyferredoxin
MVGAPGGWEYAMRRELRRRKEKAIRKEKLKNLTLGFLFFPLLLLVVVIDYAKNLHKFKFDDGK